MFKRLGSVISENKIIKAIKDRKYSSIVSACVSVGVLILLAALDAVMLHALYSGQYCVTTILKDYVIYIVGIWLIAKIISGSPIIRFSPVILTKLLGNAIAPSNLGVVYLLVFVIHLGWLTDSTFNIISVGSQGLDVKYLVPLVCSIGGLVCIVDFFPDPYKKKNDEASTVIVSGMSVISKKFLNNLKTALEENDINKVLKTNIIPLVRMLKLHNVDKSCRLLILKSDLQKKEVLFPLNIDNKEYNGQIKDKERIEKLRNGICIATTYSNKSETEKEKAARLRLYEEYGVRIHPDSDKADIEFDKFLISLIKLFAQFEFPDKLELIKNLDVIFTEECDYDNYKKCFDTLENALHKYDNSNYNVEFNITPGTAVVSSVMTLLAIDADKKLYYHNQSPDKDDPKYIVPVDKTELPIENLLSQALERISGKKS